MVPTGAAATAYLPAGVDLPILGATSGIATGLASLSRVASSSISGTVRAANGDVVPQAKVTINSIDVFASQNGEFAVSLGVAPTAPLDIRVEHPLYQDFSYNEAFATTGLRLNLALARKPLRNGYAGTVNDIFGTALPNAQFQIAWGASADDTLQVAQANSSGEYQLLLPPGVSTFSVDAGDAYELFSFPPSSETFPLATTPNDLNLIIYPGEVAQVPLFLNDPAKQMQDCFDISINGLNLSRDVRTQDFNRYDPTLKRGFLRFTLQGSDFGHPIYPNLLAAYTINASVSSGELNFTHPCASG